MLKRVVQRGNPIGGLIYSTNFDPSTHQVNWWTEYAPLHVRSILFI
jgi:hypothetical protein